MQCQGVKNINNFFFFMFLFQPPHIKYVFSLMSC